MTENKGHHAILPIFGSQYKKRERNECITSVANYREENNHLYDEYEKYNNQVFVAESATFRVSFPDADAKEE